MPRPKIDVPKSAPDFWLTCSAVLALAALATVSAHGYAEVPNTIPVRFTAAGWPRVQFSRITFWIIPFVGSMLFVIAQLLTLRVHRFAYPVRITPYNAAEQYRYAIRLVQFLLTMGLLGLTYLQYHTVQVAQGGFTAVGTWILVLYTLVLVLGGGVYVRNLYRAVYDVPALRI